MLISPGVVGDINKKADRREVLIVNRKMTGKAWEAENREQEWIEFCQQMGHGRELVGWGR